MSAQTLRWSSASGPIRGSGGPLEQDPLAILVVKWLLYVSAVWLYLRTLATPAAIYTSVGLLTGALALAWCAQRYQWRLWVGLALGGISLGVASWAGQWWLDSGAGSDAHTTLLLADSTYFGLMTFGSVMLLRTISARWRVGSVLEVAFVVGAVMYTFIDHRNRKLTEPRFLSDWALSQGMDPTKDILMPLGVGVAVVAVLMMLRAQRVLKVLLTFAVLVPLSWAAYKLWDPDPPKPEIDTNGLGLTSDEKGKEKDADGNSSGGGGGGSGNNKNPFDGPSSPPKIIVPVAVAVLHDDFKPLNDLFYFRQQALSRYNGHHLVAVIDGAQDQDVITDFPTRDPIKAAPAQAPEFHVQVPTSMFLLNDHPQPVALTNSVEVSPLENPNPDHFVAAYKVTSLALSMDYSRLIGRKSIPAAWDEATRQHYLEIPDDPRYAALSDIIVRDLDPRFADDDVMRAFVIKRYLEQEGFYTRKERHADDVDPAASFLFGSMRGYCVHFAHAAVYLFRSQGIAARVALGYAVDAQTRRGGSAVMINNDRAHAWPEIHVEGVGWVTFDIYPERSDEPPGQMVDQDLESVLGELARKDKTGGKAADPNAEPFEIPWALVGEALLLIVSALLASGYVVKFGRVSVALVVGGATGERWLFRAALDRFSDLGLTRLEGESRERFARRLESVAPSLGQLTLLHMRRALGGPAPTTDSKAAREAYTQVRREMRQNIPFARRALGWVNPLGWWFTR